MPKNDLLETHAPTNSQILKAFFDPLTRIYRNFGIGFYEHPIAQLRMAIYTYSKILRIILPFF